MADDFQEHSDLFWEIGSKEYSMIGPANINGVPCTSPIIELKRDEEYKLTGKIVGDFDDSKKDDTDRRIPGTKVAPLNISGKDGTGGFEYNIENCVIINSYRSTSSGSQTFGKYNAKLIVGSVRLKYSDKKTNRLVDWYLNGPCYPLMFYRPTEYSFGHEVKIERDPTESSEIEPDYVSGMKALDHFHIKGNSYEFNIIKVHGEFEPSWAMKTGIEFCSDWGKIPNQEERIAIGELISFLFGRQLLYVGQTSYKDLDVQEAVSYNPWGDNVRSVCKSVCFPPMRTRPQHFEELVRSLLPPYLNLRNEYQMDEALWKYWIGLTLPIGCNIPIMATGTEILAKGWFESSRSKTKGVYMESGRFKTLFKEELESMEKKLDGVDNGKIILNKINGSYKMGNNERLDTFFSEIKIPLSDAEKKASLYRNKMIHDAMDLEKIDIRELVRLTYAYRSLFHRIMLKLLGHSGKYIDYSMARLPEKPLCIGSGAEMVLPLINGDEFGKKT